MILDKRRVCSPSADGDGGVVMTRRSRCEAERATEEEEQRGHQREAVLLSEAGLEVGGCSEGLTKCPGAGRGRERGQQ